MFHMAHLATQGSRVGPKKTSISQVQKQENIQLGGLAKPRVAPTTYLISQPEQTSFVEVAAP